MTIYAILRLVHVVVAVLGTGTIAALAIVARGARRHAGSPQASAVAGPQAASLGPLPALATWASASLAVMLATGIWIDLEMHGIYHVALWFRASAIGLVVTGALLGILRRQLAGARRGTLALDQALARIAGLAVAASLLVLVIVVLMELRPT